MRSICLPGVNRFFCTGSCFSMFSLVINCLQKKCRQSTGSVYNKTVNDKDNKGQVHAVKCVNLTLCNR